VLPTRILRSSWEEYARVYHSALWQRIISPEGETRLRRQLKRLAYLCGKLLEIPSQRSARIGEVRQQVDHGAACWAAKWHPRWRKPVFLLGGLAMGRTRYSGSPSHRVSEMVKISSDGWMASGHASRAWHRMFELRPADGRQSLVGALDGESVSGDSTTAAGHAHSNGVFIAAQLISRPRGSYVVARPISPPVC
jgi:hypothetical protein